MTQVAGLLSKPLKERYPHVRLLVVVIPILYVPPARCGLFSVAVADFSTIKAGIGALSDGKPEGGGNGREDGGGENGGDMFACFDLQIPLYLGAWEERIVIPRLLSSSLPPLPSRTS